MKRIFITSFTMGIFLALNTYADQNLTGILEKISKIEGKINYLQLKQKNICKKRDKYLLETKYIGSEVGEVQHQNLPPAS